MRRFDGLGFTRIQNDGRVLRVSISRDLVSILCLDGRPTFYFVGLVSHDFMFLFLFFPGALRRQAEVVVYLNAKKGRRKKYAERENIGGGG